MKNACPSVALLMILVFGFGCDQPPQPPVPQEVDASPQPTPTPVPTPTPAPKVKKKPKVTAIPAEAWEKPDNLPTDLWAVYDTWRGGNPKTIAINLAGERKELTPSSLKAVLDFKYALVSDGAAMRCVSIDGTDRFKQTEHRVFIAPDASARLVVTDEDLHVERGSEIIPVSRPPHQLTSVAWSPRGDRLLITTRESIKTESGKMGSVHHLAFISIDAGTATFETFQQKAHSPAWHASGTKFTFVDQSDKRNWMVCVGGPDGQVKKIAPGSGPQWAGDWIVFGHYGSESKSQNVMRGNEQGAHVVNDAPGSWRDYSVSPDGKQVAFIGHRKDYKRTPEGYAQEELVVANVETGEVSSLSNVPGNPGGPPHWSPDGRYLLVRNSFHKRATLMCVPLDTSVKAFLLANDANEVGGWIRQ